MPLANAAKSASSNGVGDNLGKAERKSGNSFLVMKFEARNSGDFESLPATFGPVRYANRPRSGYQCRASGLRDVIYSLTEVMTGFDSCSVVFCCMLAEESPSIKL